jgi:diguanylate cyclase (GGDEF)-like protein
METEVDLFEYEQHVFDNAIDQIVSYRKGNEFNFKEFIKITKEYGWLLKQHREATRLADRVMNGLHEINLDLADKVHYDALTGLYNRRYMEDALERIISSIARTGTGQLSVLMLDVDYFKNYNDTYGHGAGDVCLKSIAKVLLRSVTRASDFAVRYGGEEFVIILPNTSRRGACKIAEKILKSVRDLNIPHEKSDAANCVTISIGITTGYIDPTQNGNEFIERADVALYMSKQNGRNKCTFLDFKIEEEGI